MELLNETKNAYYLQTLFIINALQNGKIFTKQEFFSQFLNLFNKKDSETESDYISDLWQNIFIYDQKNDSVKLNPDFQAVNLSIRLTNIEKGWLLAVLKDPRSLLFLDNSLHAKLLNKLCDTTDTINTIIKDCGLYGNSDDITNSGFVNNFKIILKAIHDNKLLRYSNSSSNPTALPNKGLFTAIPYAVEYSILEGKFRVSMYSLDQNRPIKVNLEKLYVVTIGNKSLKTREELFAEIDKKRVKEPLTLKISDEKKNQIIERCFALFSTYDREGQYEKQDNSYILKVFYYTFDETEIIRKILMLGTDVNVIGNTNIINKYKECLILQKHLIKS